MSEEIKEKQWTKKELWRYSILAFLVVLGLFLASWRFTMTKVGDEPNKDFLVNISRGESCEMFGALNTLFSGLAFAAIVITLKEFAMQREELILTREELSQTREELAGQKEVLKEQLETMKSQNEVAQTQLKINVELHASQIIREAVAEFEKRMEGICTLSDAPEKLDIYIKEIVENLKHR